MDVRRVARQQHPALPVPVGLPRRIAEPGHPTRAVHAEVGARDPEHGLPQPLERHRFPLAGDTAVVRGDHPVPARLEGDHREVALRSPLHEERLGGGIGEFDIAEQRGHRRRGPGKADAGEFAHRAAPAVAAHEVAGAQCRGGGFRPTQVGLDAGAVLADPGHLGRPAHPYAELNGPLLQQPLDGGLQEHQRPGMPALESVEVQPQPREVPHRVPYAGRQKTVQDAPLVQHFHGPGVHPAGSRLAGPLREPVGHHHVDTRQP